MDIKKYLKTLTNDELATLASKAGTKPSYLPQIASGFRKASPTLAKSIELATNGQVTREELRPDIFL